MGDLPIANEFTLQRSGVPLLQIRRILGNIYPLQRAFSVMYNGSTDLRTYLFAAHVTQKNSSIVSILERYGVLLSDLPLLFPADLETMGISPPIMWARILGNVFAS